MNKKINKIFSFLMSLSFIAGCSTTSSSGQTSNNLPSIEDPSFYTNKFDEEKIPEIIVFGEQNYIVKALEYSKNLRANDVYCENSTFETLAETKEYALSKGIKKVCVVGETVREEIL